eukprot:6175103-Pleurochrysis_carterae.AAC.3
MANILGSTDRCFWNSHVLQRPTTRAPTRLPPQMSHPRRPIVLASSALHACHPFLDHQVCMLRDIGACSPLIAEWLHTQRSASARESSSSPGLSRPGHGGPGHHGSPRRQGSPRRHSGSGHCVSYSNPAPRVAAEAEMQARRDAGRGSRGSRLTWLEAHHLGGTDA